MPENHQRRLASLALFSTLFNQKKSVFSILEEFAKDLIIRHNLLEFTAEEIKSLFKSEFGFSSIPTQVITTVLKRIYKKENGKFINEKQYKCISEPTIKKVETIAEDNETIINLLVQFVEQESKIELSEEDKGILIQCFCKFVLGESTSQYEEYISSFIISKQDNLELKKQINLIKEGVILYAGIQYNEKVNELGRWNSSLNIYLEQEILFHSAGYNGMLFKQLFEDFLSLVKEINSKSEKKLISLKYFPETKTNILSFFERAEEIVSGYREIDFSNEAMYNIVQGCKWKSDVTDKCAKFFTALKDKEITIDEFDYSFDDPMNNKYNIHSKKLCDYFEKEYPEVEDKKIDQCLRFMTYINYKRNGNNNVGFDSIHHIILSGNSTTLNIGFNDQIKSNGEVPFVTHLDFLINKFWFKLNKGFGSGNLPKSFDVGKPPVKDIFSDHCDLSIFVGKQYYYDDQGRNSSNCPVL